MILKTKNNATAFSYLFTPNILNDFFNHKEPNKIIKIFQEFKIENVFTQNTTLRELFDSSYKLLISNYRNEYVFKNAIASKILLGRHSINSSVLFTEFRVETSKADVVIFNGTSHVYEIKTDLDNFERLQKQINDYQKVFEYVNIVLNEPKDKNEKKIEEVKRIVDESVGILILTNQYTLKTIRKAKQGLDNLDKSAIFNILRKNEYLKIVKTHMGYVPNVPNTQIHSVCKELFVTLPIEVIHKDVLKALKNRKNYENIVDNIKSFPDSLKIAILEADLSKEEQYNFHKLLNTKINHIFKQGEKNVSSIS